MATYKKDLINVIEKIEKKLSTNETNYKEVVTELQDTHSVCDTTIKKIGKNLKKVNGEI
tara:strand:+ start:306 stop:482 length:177 start_codon:yes stop_codon:yes gene_type:complete